MMRILSLVILFFCLFLPCQTAAEPLKVATSVKPPYSTVRQDGFLDRLFHELFRRLELDYELVRLPPARALMAANHGESDFEGPRISGMEEKYKNLIMIPEPLMDYSFVGLAVSKQLQHVNWDDFGNRTVGLILGWKVFERTIKADTHHLHAKNPKQLFEMLYAGRIDIAMYEHTLARSIMHELGINAHELTPPLAESPVYLYANATHRNIVPKLAACLREIKQDGTYDRLKRETIGTQ